MSMTLLGLLGLQTSLVPGHVRLHGQLLLADVVVEQHDALEVPRRDHRRVCSPPDRTKQGESSAKPHHRGLSDPRNHNIGWHANRPPLVFKKNKTAELEENSTPPPHAQKNNIEVVKYPFSQSPSPLHHFSPSSSPLWTKNTTENQFRGQWDNII